MAEKREWVTEAEYQARVADAKRRRTAGPCVVREMTDEEKEQFDFDVQSISRSKLYQRGW